MEGAKGRATVLVTKDEIEATEGPGKRPASTRGGGPMSSKPSSGFKTLDAPLPGEKWLEIITSGAVGNGTLIHHRY